MPFNQSKPYTLDRVVRIGISLAMLYATFRLLDYLSGVLVPFVIAMLIAYLIFPMVEFLQKHIFKHRLISVIFTILFVITVIVGLFSLIVPLIVSQMEKMATLISNLVDSNTGGNLPEYLASIENYVLEFVKQEEVQAMLNMSNIEKIAETVLPGVMGIFSGSLSILGGILGLTIIIFYIVFILIDYDEVIEGWQNFIPSNYKKPILMVLGDLKNGMATYFRAQAVIVAIIAVLFSAGFTIIGLPLGILLGVFVGLLNFVPYFQNIGFIPATFLAMMYSLETGNSFWAMMGLVVLVFGVVQLIQDAVLTPKIMGDATGLNPAAILLSLTIWGKLLGILGLLIAIPITTILIAYYKRFVMAKELKNDANKDDINLAETPLETKEKEADADNFENEKNIEKE